MNYRPIASTALTAFFASVAGAQEAQRESHSALSPVHRALNLESDLLDDEAPPSAVEAMRILGISSLLQPAASYDALSIQGGGEWRWLSNADYRHSLDPR